MSDTVIKIENISKQYRLGQIGSGTLTHDLNRWWHKVKGKEDPYLRIGEVNTRDKKGESQYVWALKDINFDIKKGDSVGIIGKNGAGKSTLLKILSRVTGPTTGSFKVKGRIASLLEVGTGFHPELTGKENIYMNGAILGMTRHEIKNKFDEIVAFSGIERYIDTPAKRYSSGMYVRLAFAVAAHLNSEILIADEVLAVGDLEFQKKCLGKMKDIANEGRTVLFVSHNMAAVQRLCTTGIFLKHGQISSTGNISSVISEYLASSDTVLSVYNLPAYTEADNIDAFAYTLQVEDTDGNLINEIPVGKSWQIRVKFKLHKNLPHFIIGLGLVNNLDISIRTSWSKEVDLEKGDYEVVFKEENLMLASGKYHINVGLSSYQRTIQYIEDVGSLNISDVPDSSLDASIIRTSRTGFFLNPMNVQISNIKK
jgi:lipopolysaccharide transport system ATP-binding protein